MRRTAAVPTTPAAPDCAAELARALAEITALNIELDDMRGRLAQLAAAWRKLTGLRLAQDPNGLDLTPRVRQFSVSDERCTLTLLGYAPPAQFEGGERWDGGWCEYEIEGVVVRWEPASLWEGGGK